MIFKHKKVYKAVSSSKLLAAGAFGGGREGVQRAEYRSSFR
jgi:hypothetical protein